MIEMKDDTMETIMAKALNEINGTTNTILISMTKRVTAMDPVIFFENAKKMDRERNFWSSPLEDFYIVGIGSAKKIVGEEERLEFVEGQWEALLEQAMIHNPYKLPGTGIVMLGGMSFDSRKEATDLWRNYQPSEFTIPEFILTKYKQEYYYTVIQRIDVTSQIDELTSRLKQIEETLFLSTTLLPQRSEVLEKVEVAPEQWLDSVEKAIEHLQSEQAKKIVLAREMQLKLTNPVEISILLQQLIDMQPTSYVFAFDHGGDCFVGATPERLVKIEGETLLSTCLAGTAPRGETEAEDVLIAEQLLNDEKNREEHDYVVQMIRDHIERYCEVINIPETPIIYPLKNLQHLYTPVIGRLKSGYSIFNIIEALHPTPALGGSPREESLAFIREYELLDRGWYGAPVGWLDSNQNGEFAVAIRSGLIRGDKVSLFAGCGIMEDSDTQSEYEETQIKFLPMLLALGGTL